MVTQRFLMNSLMEEVRDVIEDGNILLNVHREVANPDNVEDIRLKSGAAHLTFVRKDFLDLAIFYRVIVARNDKETVSFRVTQELLDKLDISVEELDSAAVRNDRLDYKCEGMMEVLFRLTGRACFNSEPGDDFIKVLTNKTGMYGACVLADPEFLTLVAADFDDDLLIFPSSVHECIAIPASTAEDLEYMREMVRTINMNEVEEDERLSDSVYYYDRNEKTVRVA